MPQLSEPVGPEDHVFGAADAPATLVEYADFECPSCAIAHRAIQRLQRQFGARLRFVFRHFPRFPERHPLAEPAAELVEYAATEGKFWPLHDALWAHQTQLTPEKLIELAEQHGLDPDEARAAMEQQRFRDRIARDAESAKRSGGHTTPTLFLNGELYTGPSDYPSLAAAVEAAAGSAAR